MSHHDSPFLPRLLQTFLLSLLLAGSLRAEIRLPHKAYTLDQLDAAKKEATQKRRLIAFIKYNEASEQEFVEEAVKDYCKQLRSRCVLVYVPSTVKASEAPDLVFNGLKAVAGRGYPKVVVTDREVSKLITSIPYIKEEDRKDKFKPHKRKINEAAKKK